MATRAGEKSSFAVACNLLSNYIKQNGGITDLNLGNPKVESEKPTTMSFLPGLNASQEKKEETEEKPIMDLLTGFGSTEPKSSEKERNQLTIFYGGKILVLDNFPAEKAKDLMNMASKSTPEPANQSATPVPSPVPVQSPARPAVCDLPIARKASLHRFLEKRKDRLNARAPYNKVPISPEKSNLGKKEVPISPEKSNLGKKEETWLGLDIV